MIEVGLVDGTTRQIKADEYEVYDDVLTLTLKGIAVAVFRTWLFAIIISEPTP